MGFGREFCVCESGEIHEIKRTSVKTDSKIWNGENGENGEEEYIQKIIYEAKSLGKFKQNAEMISKLLETKIITDKMMREAAKELINILTN